MYEYLYRRAPLTMPWQAQVGQGPHMATEADDQDGPRTVVTQARTKSKRRTCGELREQIIQAILPSGW